MSVGVVISVPTGTAHQYRVPSGYQAPSVTVLNPNDGVVYIARNRDASVNTTAGWDYKVPSQSYASLPGPYITAGVFYLDQSGSGRPGEITLYDIPQKLTIPSFVAIGRAVQQIGSAVDIAQGVQPANPPAGSSRLWIDANNNLHVLTATGVDQQEIDTNDVLGGILAGSLPNPLGALGMDVPAIRAQAIGPYTAGAGLELDYDQTIDTGYLQAYRRTGSVGYKKLIINGTPIVFAGGGPVDFTSVAVALPSNSVGSAQIADGNVGTLELADNAVTSPKIVLRAVTDYSTGVYGGGISTTSAALVASGDQILTPVVAIGDVIVVVFVVAVNIPANAIANFGVQNISTGASSGGLMAIAAGAALRADTATIVWITTSDRNAQVGYQWQWATSSGTITQATGGTGAPRTAYTIVLKR